jgi:Domain of unknown function (DUF927)
MFAAALSFVGPICKPFGLRAPGVQAVGDAANGKTVFGIIAGATWGGNPDSSLGFGCAWNGTPNGLEEYPPAHNQALIVLDETSLMPTDEKGRVLSFGEALMRLKQGQGKERFNSRAVQRWSSPLISTSNFSVFHLLNSERRKNYEAYVDRLIDIPPPDGSSSFFENRHGFKDADTFGLHLFELATQNFGHPSRAFLTRFTAELARDRTGLTAMVAAHIAKYKGATDGITSPTRKVQRVRGYFATVYAAGRLAFRYRILPFNEAELLAAIMSCHRDHVAFVDADVARASGRVIPAPIAQGAFARQVAKGAVAGQNAIADDVAPIKTPFDRFQRFMNKSRKRFIDAHTPVEELPEHELQGYVLFKDDEPSEYWILPEVAEKIAGGASEANELKTELESRRLIFTTGRGKKRKFAVKRPVPGQGRRYVLAILSKAKG